MSGNLWQIMILLSSWSSNRLQTAQRPKDHFEETGLYFSVKVKLSTD